LIHSVSQKFQNSSSWAFVVKTLWTQENLPACIFMHDSRYCYSAP